MHNLILFLKEPIPGKAKTRLGAEIGHAKAAKVYSLLLEDNLRLLDSFKNTDQLFYFLSEKPSKEYQIDFEKKWGHCHLQEGSNLGDRMAHAINMAYKNNPSPCILLGSDTAFLSKQSISDCKNALTKCDITLGPALDGGYYLIAMNRPHQSVFEKIHWSTETVLSQQLKNAKKANLTYKLLTPLMDIDTKKDYLKYLDMIK